MKRIIHAATLLFVCAPFASAQHLHPLHRVIEFPDVPGYQTLACDFHTHTVFSDGHVWPSIRVQEAQRDGLDCISMTDHIEYQPHLDDIPHPDRNRSYEVALEEAGDSGLIVIRGSEITRSMPPGHANAIFLQDANALMVEDSVAVFEEATRQGAFNFWNHPHWTSQRKDGVATLTGMHRRLIEDGLLQGIEVVNNVTYSDEAIQIALDHDLTMIGTSDIHGLVDWQYDVPHGGHRPVTLVFAEEKSAEAIKSALVARRTAVWFNNLLIGREAQLMPLIEAALEISSATYSGDTTVLEVEISNTSDVGFILDNRSGFNLHRNADVVMLAPQQATVLHVKTIDRLETVTLEFDVMNAISAPNEHPVLTIEVPVD